MAAGPQLHPGEGGRRDDSGEGPLSCWQGSVCRVGVDVMEVRLGNALRCCEGVRAWSRVCWRVVWQWFPMCGDMLRACVWWRVRLSGPLYPWAGLSGCV